MKTSDIRNMVEDVLVELSSSALDDDEIAEIAEEVAERLAQKFSNDIED